MNALYKIVRLLGVPLFKFLYRPIIINKENIPSNGKIILAGNHISDLDCALLISSTKRVIHFLAKKELHDSKIGFFYKSMETIPVDRTKKNPDAINKAINVLNNECVIGIFPEGTTKKDSIYELLPFKYGTVSLASKTDSLIVPFSIVNKYKIFKKSVTICFGKPYKLKTDDLEKENELLKNKVIELIKDLRSSSNEKKIW